VVVLAAGCTVSKPPLAITHTATIGPYSHPHGRILLLGNHRAQLLFSCQQSDIKGSCRFTHAASGRIVELRWQGQKIWQRSNANGYQQWQRVSMKDLYRLGLVVDPATMMQLLNGAIPAWLHPKADNQWRGKHHNARIQMQWHPDQQRLDITNQSKGAQIRLLLDH